MKINQGELIKMGTPKKEKTLNQKIIDYVKKNPNCTQGEILKHIPKDRRSIQRKIYLLVDDGVMKVRKCECGHTNFYKYISKTSK